MEKRSRRLLERLRATPYAVPAIVDSHLDCRCVLILIVARQPDELARAQPGLAGIDPPSHLRITRVVLASAHLNHDPGDNRPRNLVALCQRCHMVHDATEHRRRRWLNAFRLRAIGDLFA